MELVKLNETVNRQYDGEVATEEVTTVTYDIIENGSSIGNACIANGNFSVSAQIPGTMAEIRAKVEAMFAAE